MPDCTYYSIPIGGTKSEYAVWTYEKPYEVMASIKEGSGPGILISLPSLDLVSIALLTLPVTASNRHRREYWHL
ncbi:MAG: DUF427 domain-containing protein [Silvibacterium sp.]